MPTTCAGALTTSGPGSVRRLAVTARVVRAVLRSPALRRIELAFLIFNAVEYGTWVAILLFAYAAIGPTSVGLVAVVQLVPAALVAPVSASLGDRWPRDRVLLGGYVVMAVTFGATWVAMAADIPPVLVVAAAACASASVSVIRPTQAALLPSLARTPEELTAANGLSGTVEGVGLLVGPLLAAAILVVASPAAVFGAATAGCILAAALVSRLPRPASVVAIPAGRPVPSRRTTGFSRDSGSSRAMATPDSWSSSCRCGWSSSAPSTCCSSCSPSRSSMSGPPAPPC